MNAEDRERICLPLLAQVSTFRCVGREKLRFIAAGCHTDFSSKGCVVCHKGGIQDHFFCIASGRIKLAVLSEAGDEHVVEIIGPGDSFGEAPALLGEAWQTYAQALVDTELLCVGAERVREAVMRWPDVSLAMLQALSRKVQDLTDDLETCCLLSASHRVSSYLLREASAADQVEILLPASKAVVASSLNLTPETFSRELHELARKGLVDIKGSSVRLLSLERLRRLSGCAARNRPWAGGGRPASPRSQHRSGSAS